MNNNPILSPLKPFNRFLYFFVLIIAMGSQLFAQSSVLVKAQVKPGREWKEYETQTMESLKGFAVEQSDTAMDIYGGWTAKKTKATGYFYVTNDGGRFWLVDPLGHYFINKGVTSVTIGTSAIANQAVKEKFGSEERWAEATIHMLRENYFNVTGAWSSYDQIRNAKERIPYTVLWDFMKDYGKKRGGTFQQPGHIGYPNDCIFVFDPGFETYCTETAKKLVDFKNDPYLIGHFSDNEMPFPQDALNRYLQLPEKDPGYMEAIRWLNARKGTLDISTITDEDRDAFLEHVADRYFQITTRAMRKADPNHIMLGSRLYGKTLRTKAIFKAASKSIDVISINYYDKWTPDSLRMRQWVEWSGKPFIITEWYVKGEDSGLPNNSGAGWTVKTQADRGLFYQHFALRLLKFKGCVGWHWFKYIDNDPTDTSVDPSNNDANKGIVNIRFEPYAPLMQKMHDFNSRVYRIIEYFDAAPK
jgi:hypothetical protein